MSEETVPQMREQIDELQKKLKVNDKASIDLAKENRVLKARDVFREAGFNASGGELFAAQNPEGEITTEAVTSFVEKYGVGKIETVAPAGDETSGTKTEEGSGSEPAPGAADLANLSRGGSRAGEGGAGGATQEPMTRQVWEDLYRSDPAAAKVAVASGLVQISKDNFYAAQKGAQTGNPFVSVVQE